MKEDNVLDFGTIKLDCPITYTTIKDVRIEEKANQHGTMTVTLLVHEKPTKDDILRIEDTTITMKTNEDEIIFSGMISDIGVKYQNSYYQITLQVKGHTTYKCQP